MRRIRLCIFVCVTGVLMGCSPTGVIKTTARIPVSFGEEEKLKDIVKDEVIAAAINIELMKADPSLVTTTEHLVREGRVLLVGRLISQEQRKKAIDAIWKVRGVKEVLDETKIRKNGTILNYASDTWVTTKINTKLMTDNEIPSINYNVKTDDGTVYLLGIARTADELEKAVDIIKKTDGVKKVVSYVRIKEIDPEPSKFAFRDGKIFDPDNVNNSGARKKRLASTKKPAREKNKVVRLDKKYLRSSSEPDDIIVKKY